MDDVAADDDVVDEKDESAELLEAKKAVTEAFEPLINQTNRMIDFYNSRFPKSPDFGSLSGPAPPATTTPSM